MIEISLDDKSKHKNKAKLKTKASIYQFLTFK